MTEPHVSARDSESIPDVPQRLAELAREGSAVAVATVISRRAPVSAQVGDKALIHADGRMEGFVGGACSREIVRRQALLSLQGGQARLVVIVPGAAFSTSQRETTPSGLARSTMSPKASMEASWPSTSTVAEISCVLTWGRSPITPDATWAFCAEIAEFTSAGDSP